jgi:hypothetical protein
MKFLLASLKHLVILKIVPKAGSNICSGFPLLSQCTFMAGFRNNFQDHRRVSEQLLETQAAIRKPRNKLYEEGYWKEFHNKKVIYRSKQKL